MTGSVFDSLGGTSLQKHPWTIINHFWLFQPEVTIMSKVICTKVLETHMPLLHNLVYTATTFCCQGCPLPTPKLESARNFTSRTKYSSTEEELLFLLSLNPLIGFPIVRGRVELLRVPKWSDSSCKTVAFPPYRFYPDKQVHVQVTVNHMKLKDAITVHDAVTSWTEKINYNNFTVCVMQTGRKEETLNPFATIDWLAYQGAPRDGLTGKVQLQKWWSGTNCADVTFPKVRCETFLS